MLRKLYAIVSKTCNVDNPDSPQHQEVLLPGNLYAMIIKEKLEETLNQVRYQILQDIRKQETSVDFFDGKEMVFLAPLGAKLTSFRRSIRPQGLGTHKLRYWGTVGQLSSNREPRVTNGS
jgi:DNA-directed RNA polymerase beta subunit